MKDLHSKILQRQEIDDDKWNIFISDSPQYCIYALTWYLDIIQANWEAIIVYNSEGWVCVFPIKIKKKFGIYYSLQPIFSQYLGFFFLTYSTSNHSLYDRYKKSIECMIDSIPKNIRYIKYNFSPNLLYFLPFYWHGFEITPRITYQLKCDSSIEIIYNKFSSSIKNAIKKAQKANLKVFYSEKIDSLLSFMQDSNFLNQKEVILFEQLSISILDKELGFCLEVRNSENRIISSGFFIRDKHKLIFLALMTDSKFKSCGATSLLIFEALNIAVKEKFKLFDFEGSMLKNVESYFSHFNPEQIIYFEISKNKVKLITEIKVIFDRVLK